MNNLTQQLNELVNQLSINNSANDAKTEIESLNKVKSRASKVANSLARLRREHHALVSIDTELAKPPVIDDETYQQILTSIRTIESLQVLWDQNGDLSQGDYLDNALSSCHATIEKMKEIDYQVWSLWSEALKRRAFVAESLLESQRNLSTVKEVVNNYHNSWTELQERILSLPESTSEVLICQQLAKYLEELKDQMDFNIPENVDKFLKEFRFNAQPSLQKLTPEVLEWLSKKNMLGHFTLRQVN